MYRNKNIAIFLDRDGTIIEDVGYLKEPSEVTFFPETFQALRQLCKHFLLFIVTNQTGIAEGMISREDVNYINIHIIKTLAKAGIEITDLYVCPHSRSDNCICIKPKPYFLEKAAKDYKINLQRSFVIGDHPHDIQLARNVGAHGIYLLTGHGNKHLPELPEDTEVVTGIMQAAERINSFYLPEMHLCNSRRTNKVFVLDLGVACDLWQRSDLEHMPKNMKQVAQVLSEAGIEVYKISGAWLECEPNPSGLWKALTGESAPTDWIHKFNHPQEKREVFYKY